MKSTDIPYLAGLIDADGCITSSNGYNFRLTFANTNKDICIWVQDTFGGNVNNMFLPHNVRHNIAFKWVICSKKDLLCVLPLIIPFLRIKQAQASIVYNYLQKYPTRMNGRKRPELQINDYLLAKKTIAKLKTDLHFIR